MDDKHCLFLYQKGSLAMANTKQKPLKSTLILFQGLFLIHGRIGRAKSWFKTNLYDILFPLTLRRLI